MAENRQGRSHPHAATLVIAASVILLLTFAGILAKLPANERGEYADIIKGLITAVVIGLLVVFTRKN